jgi:hypothetical protein
MSRAKKVKLGRPPLHGRAGTRYQVHLTPDVERYLRALGEGSLSAGIRQAAIAAGFAPSA